MKHIIIGIAKTGAEALSHVYPLFYKANQDSINRDVGFFYIHDRAQGKNDLKFIIPQHSYVLPDNAAGDTVEKVEERLQHIVPNHGEVPVKEIKNSLYFYSQRFADHGEPFWQSLSAFSKESEEYDEPDRFHLMLDASDPFSVGIALQLFAQLAERHPDPIVSVYAFYPSGEKILSEKNASVLAAFLLRLSELRSADFRPYVFSFRSEAQHTAHFMACGKQIFTSIHVVPISLGTEKIKNASKNNQFNQVKELILRVDQEKVRQSLSKQIVSLLLNRLIFSSKNVPEKQPVAPVEKKHNITQLLSLAGEQHIELAHSTEKIVFVPQDKHSERVYPEWTNQLFSDKKWFLHPDYLTMEQEIFPHAGSAMVLHNMDDDWKEQTDLALAVSVDIKKWDSRFEQIHENMQNFYVNDFRGQGASSFYTVNERNLDAVAKLITAQIEEELVSGWQRGDYEIVDIPHILDKVVRLLNARLALCRGLHEEYAYNAENALGDFNALLNAWRAGGRTEKKQIEKMDAREVAKILTRHYVNLCQNKSMHFANQLLWNIIEEINVLQEQLKLVLQETKAYIRAQGMSNAEVDCRINLSVANEQEWVVFTNTDFISLMPESFAKQTDSVFEVVRDDFAHQVRAKKGLTALLKFLQDVNLIEGLKRLVLLEHPIFHANRLNSLHNLVFWHTVPNFLVNPPENFNRELYSFSAIDTTQEDVNSIGLWLVPSAPLEDESLDSIISALRTYSPSSNVLINVKMTEPYLIFRSMCSYSLKTLPGFDLISNGYEKTLGGTNGAVNALLLHPENNEPFPSRLNQLLHLSPADDIRRVLLLGEVYGLIKERQNAEGKTEIYSDIGNEMVLGESFLDALKKIDAARFKYLNWAVDKAATQTVTVEHHHILQNRLEKIKLFCLNGKTDIRKADWKEAGLYMPWSRAAEKLLPSLGVDKADE